MAGARHAPGTKCRATSTGKNFCPSTGLPRCRLDDPGDNHTVACTRMCPESWPSPDPADEHGLVALDFHLTADRVISAYRHGIFPWPHSNPRYPIPWVCPPERAILEFDALHLPRSLRQAQRRQSALRFTFDRAFATVIRECAKAARPGQRGTWITPAMITAYEEVHARGHAHSVEAWEGETLVAGLYGVTAGGVFAGESMFHHRDNASKLCLLHVVAHLQQRGSTWLDIQQLTPHLAALGAREIPRRDFLRRLKAESTRALILFP